MVRQILTLALFLLPTTLRAQSPTPRPSFDTFDVATIKPIEPDAKSGRYIKMEGADRFIAKAYNLKLLIAAAYDLNPRTISGGPAWVESDRFDILATTPTSAAAVRPTHDEQMAMLRHLLTERFNLTFHRQAKDFSIYELQLAKDGPRLKPTATPGAAPSVVSTVYPQHVLLPARNASMQDFTSVLQRAILDRPVVDKTGLTGRYDFDLDWAPDETQFGGALPTPSADAPAAPLFTALQQQLGLKLVATRGPVQTLVIDQADRPSAN